VRLARELRTRPTCERYNGARGVPARDDAGRGRCGTTVSGSLVSCERAPRGTASPTCCRTAGGRSGRISGSSTTPAQWNRTRTRTGSLTSASTWLVITNVITAPRGVPARDDAGRGRCRATVSGSLVSCARVPHRPGRP
jgi:hypothetical protein